MLAVGSVNRLANLGLSLAQFTSCLFYVYLFTKFCYKGSEGCCKGQEGPRRVKKGQEGQKRAKKGKEGSIRSKKVQEGSSRFKKVSKVLRSLSRY